jgi:branched-chain amino acid transport system permease protein
VEEFLQLTVAGLALGSRYALVALGYVAVFAATRVINLAHPGFVVLGAYVTYNAHQTWGLPFPVAILAAAAVVAGVAVVVERTVVRRLVAQEPWVAAVGTIGVLIVLNQIVPRIWGYSQLDLGDPWGIDGVEVAGIVVLEKDLWAIGLTAAAVVAYFAFLRFARHGLALRAAAADPEAAAAQGISPDRVYALSFAIAGATAALAGAMLGSGAGAVGLGIGTVAFAALPAMILGGLDSPVGAVVGGLVIGLTQIWTAGYQPEYLPWLGDGFDQVMPYVVMVAILLVRPSGMFGGRTVRSV